MYLNWAVSHHVALRAIREPDIASLFLATRAKLAPKTVSKTRTMDTGICPKALITSSNLLDASLTYTSVRVKTFVAEGCISPWGQVLPGE